MLQPTNRRAGLAMTVLVLAATIVLARPIGAAFSQEAATPGGMMSSPGMASQMPGMTMSAARMPTLPGQGAFGAIQEIVGILEADPTTDWSKVDLEALRQHLIDMNEVTLRAEEASRPVQGGLEIAVTGSGRTLVAIQRMVPNQALELSHMHGWSAKSAMLPNGVLLTVTAADPKEAVHIRGLGFIGLMASGTHHQMHHLALARGLPMH